MSELSALYELDDKDLQREKFEAIKLHVIREERER
jgi:hypothetical protein